MSSDRNLSRRRVIGSLAGGAVAGALWGVIFPATATDKRPSFAVIGHDNAQIILLDSGNARALILSGAPKEDLLNQIPAMMTVFRQRLDLIIGEHHALLRIAASLKRRWKIAHAVVLRSGPGETPLAMPTTFVSDTLNIDMGNGLSITCHIGYRNEWTSQPDRAEAALWCANIEHAGQRVVIAPNTESLMATGQTGATIAVIPAALDASMLEGMQIGAIAVNNDANPTPDAARLGVAITRIYAADIARFVLDSDRIHLPSWTVMPR